MSMTDVAMLLLAIFAQGIAVAQSSGPERPWDVPFRGSWSAQAHGQVAKARALTAQAWNIVKQAGPLSDGYSDGVELAYATSIAVSGPRRAGEFYREALLATEARRLAPVRLQILLRMAVRFQTHEEMKAKRLYVEAMDLAGTMSPQPPFLAQILTNLAVLDEKMGEPEESLELRRQAATAPGSAPLQNPIYGLADDPNDAPFNDLAPELRRLVGQTWQLILDGEYDRASGVVEKAFNLANGFPGITRYQPLYFDMVARAYCRQKHFVEASEILRRDLALAEQAWGEDHPEMASALVSGAWIYINELRDNKSAHELVERAARVTISTSGELSDAMRQVEDVRLRLAQLEGDPDAVAKHKANMEQLWAEVHGAKTKPLVLH